MRCAERARDSQPECFDDQLRGRQIQRPCRLHQLAGNRYRHLGMPFRLEVDPRSSTGLIGLLKLGFVECSCDNPLLRVQLHLFGTLVMELAKCIKERSQAPLTAVTDLELEG